MAGAPQNLEKGVAGRDLVLDVRFYTYKGGALTDDDGYALAGTLPAVYIISPTGNVLQEGTGRRVSLGTYDFTWSIPSDAEISSRYRIQWTLTINGSTVTPYEYFSVVPPGSADFGAFEWRHGDFFQNRDDTSSVHAPDWGLIVCPDELRYITTFGSTLVSPEDAQTYDDKMLQGYINRALSMLEGELRIDIIPRVVYAQKMDVNGDPVDRPSLPPEHPDALHPDDLAYIQKMTPEQRNKLVIEERGYTLRPKTYRHNHMYQELDRVPLQFLRRYVWDDITGQEILDLKPMSQYSRDMSGKIQTVISPFSNAGVPRVLPPLAMIYGNILDYPTIFADYRTGYRHSSAVPDELRAMVHLVAGAFLLNDYGVGRNPGTAGASVSLGGISESFQTAQSALSGLFQAPLEVAKKLYKEWYGRNKYRYGVKMMGAL